MKTIILLGAPGAGKGTIADGIKKATPFIHVSTGDMLRAAIAEKLAVGLEAKAYMERGELVPDQVIVNIVRERIAAGAMDAQYMFDGFPRTLEQARLLDEMLAGFNSKVDQVFLLDVPRDVLIDRITGRRIGKTSGKVYHIRNMPPKVAGVCDVDGGPLIQRADDSEAVVVNRLDVYAKQTEPLIEYYKKKGVLVQIAAAGQREQTEGAIMAQLRK